jgi:F-type H+-transporting ATPase subunit epsilon
MYVEIVTPESSVFQGEVDVVTVPGINGEFQMLDNHASIVSLLVQGKIKLKGDKVEINNKEAAQRFRVEGNEYIMEITGGTIEMNDNKIIILTD